MICIFQQFFREVLLVFLLLNLYMKHSFVQISCFMFLRFRFTSLLNIILRWLQTRWWSWFWAWWGCWWVTWPFPLATFLHFWWLLLLLWFWFSYISLTWRVVLEIWKTLIKSVFLFFSFWSLESLWPTTFPSWPFWLRCKFSALPSSPSDLID